MKNKLFFNITFFLFLIFNLNAIRMCAEWEPALGTLIRYPLGIPIELVVELAEDDLVYTLVENYDQQASVEQYYEDNGVNVENCEWIYAETYSHWTRDWGPQMRFNNEGELQVVDPMFDGYPWVPGDGNRDWSIDDAVNQLFANQMGFTNIAFPGYLTGGNVMYDGHGTAFSTQQMLDENYPMLSNDEFFNYAEEILGVDQYYITPNIESYGIQHIDCAAKLLDEETILVKQLPESHPDYDRIENFAQAIEDYETCYRRPYDIIRIYCGIYNETDMLAAAYTNSLILNDKVLVPLFGIDSDEDAIRVYEEAMPGYEIVGFEYGYWYHYDALHCRTRGVFDENMLYLSHKPLTDEVGELDYYHLSVYIDDRSETGLVDEALKVNWKTEDNDEWTTIPLTAAAEENRYFADIPNPGVGETIHYYIVAADNSGRQETLPRTAPDWFFESLVVENTNTEDYDLKNELTVNLFPNPLRLSDNSTKLNLELFAANKLNEQSLRFDVYDIKGKKVFTKIININERMNNDVVIDLKRNHISSGIYLYKLENKKNKILNSGKLMIIK